MTLQRGTAEWEAWRATLRKPKPPRSAKHSAAISNALKGKRLSVEHRAKISAALKGKPLSAEHRAKLSAVQRGKRRRDPEMIRRAVATRSANRMIRRLQVSPQPKKICSRCGTERKALHKHHKHPKSLGGSDAPDNIERLCANCHEDAHNGAFGGGLAHEPTAIAKQRVRVQANWDDPVRRARRLAANKQITHRLKAETMWSLRDRYAQSNEWLSKAEAATPGASQTASKSPYRSPVGAFPLFTTGGKGALISDIDGHDYIDWVCALGAVTLGYGHTVVDEAVCQQLKTGVIGTMPSHLEMTVAEALTEVMPAAEAVRFTKTGTEACMAAVRLARRATAREVVVTTQGSYHGWADWYVASRNIRDGVPKSLNDLIRVVPYNDLQALKAVLDQDVACVFMEPTLMTAPVDGYLPAVCRAAHGNGSLFMLDEMICGYRLALGGGSEFYHVVPDIATYGKAMGNGIPISCIVGRADVMRYADVISGTFLGDTLGLSAAAAVLKVYQAEPVIEVLHRRGQQFQDAYNVMVDGLGLSSRCDGPCWHPRVVWECENESESLVAMSLFLQEMARRGVLLAAAGLNTSYAFTDDHIWRTVDACWQALRVVRCGEWRKVLQGQVIRQLPWQARAAMSVKVS